MTFWIVEYDATVKFPCPTAVPDKYENVKCTGTICISLAREASRITVNFTVNPENTSEFVALVPLAL